MVLCDTGGGCAVRGERREGNNVITGVAKGPMFAVESTATTRRTHYVRKTLLDSPYPERLQGQTWYT